MKRYFRIYKLLIKLNFSMLTAYRFNFINSLLSSFLWGIFHPLSFILITYRIKSSFGWSKPEILILVSTFIIYWGIFHLFFARSFHKIPEIIDEGQLDGYLLKPVDSQFLLSLSWINFSAIIRIILGIIFIIYITISNHLSFTFTNILITSLLLVVSLICMYSLWFIVSTLLLWFYKLSNLIELLFNLSGVVRYPPDMFYHFGNVVFIIFLPLTFILGSPVKILLNRATIYDVIGLLFFTGLFFYISRWFWKYALRSYTSVNG